MNVLLGDGTIQGGLVGGLFDVGQTQRRGVW